MFKGIIKVGLVGLLGYGVYKLMQYTVGISLIYSNKEVAKWAHEVSIGKMSEEEFKNNINKLFKETREYIESLKNENKNENVEEVKEDNKEAAVEA